MLAPEPDRQPHATLDLGSRRAKGLKIERLLALAGAQEPLRLLEIGTGAGGIAHYFGTHPTLPCDVDAVDVHDNRQVVEGYRFTRVDGVTLPFADESFDVVISNHVIEHVGDRDAQQSHLLELRRVLKRHGQAYLAVPNRWMVVEPHFRLAFLSWLPRRLADAYVRMAGKGSHYDCRPLTAGQAEALLANAGFLAVQQHGEALALTIALERPDWVMTLALLRKVPDGVYRALRKIFPTLIYQLRKSASTRPGEA